MSEQERCLGSPRVSRAGERVLAIANFRCDFLLLTVEAIPDERLFQRDAETSTRDACATQTTHA
jgi:hypothetical protein